MLINKTLAIAALARDCEKSLISNIPRIEDLRSHFINSYVVIYENDSVDSTVNILEEWSSSSNAVYIVSEKISKENTIPQRNFKNLIPGISISRINKMSIFRNKLLEKVRAYGPPPDYLLIIDIDIYSFDVNGIIKSIVNAPLDWGALFSNGTYFYKKSGDFIPLPFQYDYYAYVDMETDVNKQSYSSMFPLPSFYKAWSLSKKINKKKFYKAMSGFGGIAIYKYNLIDGLIYNPVVPEGWEKRGCCLCEHISVNLKIAQTNHSCYFSSHMKVNYGMINYQGIKGLIFRRFPVGLSFILSIYDTLLLCFRIIFSLLLR